MTPPEVKTLLLVKMSSLGDVVHALPAVQELAARGVAIDWVVEEAFADIPAAHPHVRRVWPIAWRRWRRNPVACREEMRAFLRALRAQPYDLVIDSQGLIKSAAVALLARGRRTGFSFTTAREPWAAFAYVRGHRVARQQHAIVRQRQLLGAALGYAPGQEERSGIEVRTSRSRRVLLLHGTTWDSKHWPVPMWRALAQQIQADGYEPWVTWGNVAEQQRAVAIAQGGSARILDKQPLPGLAEFMAQAAAVIGVDSGLAHYSAALGTPTVGLYGPTAGALTGVRGRHAVSLQAATACSPCMDKRCRHYQGEPLQWQGERVYPPCFASLPPAHVWQQAQQLMRGALSSMND